MGTITRRDMLRFGAVGAASQLFSPLEVITQENWKETVNALIQEGKFEAAEKIVLDQRKKEDIPEIALVLGGIYWKQKRYDKAVPELERAHKEFPDNPSVLLGLGDSYFSTKQYEKSITINEKLEPFLKDATFLDVCRSQQAKAHYELARVFTRKSDEGVKGIKELDAIIDKSLAHVEAALKHDAFAKSAEARTLRGSLLVGKGRYKEARKDYAFAVSMKSSDLLYLKGFIHTFMEEEPHGIIAGFNTIAADTALTRRQLYDCTIDAYQHWRKQHAMRKPFLKDEPLPLNAHEGTTTLWTKVADHVRDTWLEATKDLKPIDRYDKGCLDVLEYRALAAGSAYCVARKDGKSVDDALKLCAAQIAPQLDQVAEVIGSRLKEWPFFVESRLSPFTFEGKEELFKSLPKEKRK